MSRITAWGNSHGVRIPREVLEQADIAPESEVTITAEAGRTVIQPARRRPTLPELLAQIRPGDRFDEVDYGAPRGREVLWANRASAPVPKASRDAPYRGHRTAAR